MLDKLTDKATSILQTQRTLGANTLAFESAMHSFDFPIALWVIGRSSNVGHAANADKRLEVVCDELRSVVGNYSRLRLWKLLACSLNHDLNIRLFHLLAILYTT